MKRQYSKEDSEFHKYEEHLLLETDLPVSEWDWLDLEDLKALAIRHGYTEYNN